MNLTHKQQTENEEYFLKVLNTLAEGGVFGWKDLGEVLVKRNRKFQCQEKAYNKAKEIVTQDFFNKNFELKVN